jgi:hypothetical protein
MHHDAAIDVVEIVRGLIERFVEFTVHAGAEGQSEILFLRPEFVPRDYRKAETLTGRNLADLARITKVNGWAGYSVRHDWPARRWVRKHSHFRPKS